MSRDETEDSTVATMDGDVRGCVVDGVSIFRGVPYGAPTEGGEPIPAPQPVEPVDGRTSVSSVRRVGSAGEELAGRGRCSRATVRRSARTAWASTCGRRARRRHAAGDGVAARWRLRGRHRFVDALRRRRTSPGAATSWSSRSTTASTCSATCTSPTCRRRLRRLGQRRLPRRRGRAAVGAHNIAGFGGDPGNVTIYGQSGGGRKVSIATAAPAAVGSVPPGHRPERIASPLLTA